MLPPTIPLPYREGTRGGDRSESHISSSRYLILVRTDSCYYDTTATIVTSGTLLANGYNSETVVIPAGERSLTIELYHINDGTISEWMNVTLSGECVTRGPITRPTQSNVISIYSRMLFHSSHQSSIVSNQPYLVIATIVPYIYQFVPYNPGTVGPDPTACG
jgi:hypothetical protein